MLLNGLTIAQTNPALADTLAKMEGANHLKSYINEHIN
jgi:hypothetical protein